MTCKKDSFTEKDIPNLEGYVVIVTGGNGGIGYETSLQLALRGARVYVASRSAERVEKCFQQMRQSASSSSPDAHPNSLDLHFLQVDLQDLKSVRAAAAAFMAKEERLDILINNAAIMTAPYKLTGDGFESQFQVNYMGPFILTAELMPLLLDTAARCGSKDRVRVVNVSSDAALLAGPTSMQLDDVNLENEKGWMELWRRYGHSKQGSIRHAKAINDRYSDKGVTAYSLHPGIVKSNLQGHDPGLVGKVIRAVMYIAPSTSPLGGALNSLYAATSPDAPALAAGAFLTPVGKVNPRADAFTGDGAGNDALWEYSVRVWERYKS